jgi:hypothetical protein
MIEIQNAYAWTNDLGQDIKDLFPNGIPRTVITGLLSFHNGIQSALADEREDHEREIKRKESENKRR